MRLKPSKGQRWRVSVYPPGVDENVPKQYPLKHHACRERVTAQKHFERYAMQIGKGEIGRVILHQGKLYIGYNAYMHYDTRWKSEHGGPFDAGFFSVLWPLLIK